MMTWEAIFLKFPRGAASRARLALYLALGMRMGMRNRIEGGGRCRRLSQIEIGNFNAFTQGCWLWPEDSHYGGVRIRIGSRNYFNRNVMIDACGLVEIGSGNMFGPDIYITDSDHTVEPGRAPSTLSMRKGHVRIGNNCWIGAKAVLLRGAVLNDGCVVGAGAVVRSEFPANSVIAGVPARLIRQYESGQLAINAAQG